MRIKVADKAKRKILHTAKYIKDKFGKETSVGFRDEIRLIRNLLRENPEIGLKEPLLSDAPVTYRSIVINHLNKLVYWINDDIIEIIDFWDCRREPTKQRDQLLNPKQLNENNES